MRLQTRPYKNSRFDTDRKQLTKQLTFCYRGQLLSSFYKIHVFWFKKHETAFIRFFFFNKFVFCYIKYFPSMTNMGELCFYYQSKRGKCFWRCSLGHTSSDSDGGTNTRLLTIVWLTRDLLEAAHHLSLFLLHVHFLIDPGLYNKPNRNQKIFIRFPLLLNPNLRN